MHGIMEATKEIITGTMLHISSVCSDNGKGWFYLPREVRRITHNFLAFCSLTFRRNTTNFTFTIEFDLNTQIVSPVIYLPLE
jgi:hypothetical protein